MSPRSRRTKLGSQGLEVSRMGLGCMPLSPSYLTPDPVESMKTFERAIELGITFMDTANVYSAGENEIFVGKAIKGRRDQIELVSKFGLTHDGVNYGADGRPEYVKQCCEESLQRLGVDTIDLYYQHRVDPDVPIEETVGAMAELIAEGKVRFLGLSEPSADELRRAHATHPITAVQNEWSLWARQMESDMLPVARELGVGIVPFAPLGRGILAGAITKDVSFDEDDLRASDPRLQGENLIRNVALVERLTQMANDLGAAPGQVALAWLMAQGDDVVPIPGTERVEFLEQNVGALDVEFTQAQLQELDALFAPGVTAGNADEVLARTIVSKSQG